MKKETITQRDAILILLNYRPNITFESISGELPGYYRKKLTYAVQKLICDELVDYYPAKDGKSEKYMLTKGGKKTFYERFAKLRKDDKTANQLEHMIYAFDG